MLATAETALLALVTEALGSTITRPQGIGGQWSPDELQRALNAAPTVRVAYTGGAVDPESPVVRHAAGWSVYVICRAATEDARRAGTAQIIGAFEALDRLLSVLHGRTVPGLGTLSVHQVDNLFLESGMDLGAAVYALRLRWPVVPAPAINPLEDLATFAQFHADYDLPPFTPDHHAEWLAEDPDAPAPDAQDTIAITGD